MAGEQGAQHAQRVGQDIGHHHIGFDVGQLARQVEICLHGVLRGVVAAGLHRLRVDVHAQRPASAKLERGDGQNARAATVVQHRFAGLQLAVQPLQAQPGGRVAAGAKRQARIQLQIDGVRVGRFVPGGGDPQPVRNADRVELRLGGAHPVLLGDFFHLPAGGGHAALAGGGGDQQRHILRRVEQRQDAAGAPHAVHRLAGFAKNRLFGVGAGGGVFNRRRQRAQVHQRVGEFFRHGGIGV